MSNSSSEEDLFNRALKLPGEERAAFLKEACGGDEALRSGIEDLLAAHEVDSAFVDNPSEEVAELSAQWKESSIGGKGAGSGDGDGAITTTASRSSD